jgi:hypothetical protein
MVRIFYSLNKIRHVIEVPWKQSRHVNKALFKQGAAVYWTEFMSY